MAFIWIDKKDGEDFIFASDINGIANELINVGKDSAKKDLSNVDNEAFKAKAEEAGVGGDNAELLGDAPMVFKGVVDALPETANDGEVYKLHTVTNNEICNYSPLYGFITITPDSWKLTEPAMPDFVASIISAIDSGITNFEMVITDMSGAETRYTINVVSWENAGDYTIIYGNTNVSTETYFENGETAYVYADAETEKTVVRFNGEWVEL